MSERFLTRSAVMLFLLRKNNENQEILLQKRFNTGYADGIVLSKSLDKSCDVPAIGLDM